MFSGQFYEKRLSVGERSTKLLLETVTYIAIKERHLHNYTVMCIMYCRKYHMHNYDRDTICIITIKIVTHIFAAETVTCIYAAETCNCITATETVTCIRKIDHTERLTNILVTESNTCKPAKMQQTLSLA